MNTSKSIRPILLASAVSLLSGGVMTAALAAPGPIAETPLFLTNYPQANIFFMLDDSGSMDWEIMVQGNGGRFRTNQPDGRHVDLAGNPVAIADEVDNAIQQRDRFNSGSGGDDNDANATSCPEGGYSGTYIYSVEFGSNTYTDSGNDCRTADDRAWRFRNNDFNPLYFDPTRHYDPWYGKNSHDQTYRDVSITDAPDNPYTYNFATPPGTSETINLTIHTSNWQGSGSLRQDNTLGFFFYTWSDLDNDNNFDNGEQTEYRIGDPAIAIQPEWTIPDGSRAKTVAELQQDFANWFSYYRKREYVAKRAISQLIYEATARVGMSTLHNHNTVGVPVKDIDNISTPVSTTADASKTDLLQRLAQINSSNGTPLRLGLRNVGNYFDMGTNSNVGDLFGGTAHSSPILSANDGGSCQQNFSILMSDGFWNGGSPGVNNTDTDGTGPWDGGSYADALSNTLADVAMHYYETDLATSLDNDVPITAGVDENDAQHLVTFTVAFGIDGTLNANPTDVNAAFAWPDPINNTGAERIDDMRHAAWNARGQFLSARTPGQLVDALGAAIKDIEKRSGSAAAVSFNSTSLQTDTRVFQAKFDSGGWHGDLRALDLNILLSAGTGGLLWEAAEKLDTRNIVAQPRAIITYDGANGIAFEFPPDYQNPATDELTSAQVKDLLFNAPYPLTTTDTNEIAANQAFGSAVVDFLRGHHDEEGSGIDDFRQRNNHRLGDIVHSGPIYVGPPSTPYPDDIESASHLYSTWAQSSAMKNRLGRVYVGSNGGMLHVLNADTGDEVFAYIPGLVYSDQDGEGLHQLAERGYVHDYYVDLTPTVADVFHDGGWKTLLIGGLRGGGKGIFVMDITQPTALTEGNAANVVLDEFTHADLGYTFSEIQVGRLNNGKWAAIFGNGFNNTGSGRAKLFIYYFDGTTPDIIDTEVGQVPDSGSCTVPDSTNPTTVKCNGLSTPELVDLNGDGNMDRAYAGDLQGNLWAFDLTKKDGNWSPRSAYPVTGGTPQPLFTACAATPCTISNRQPITSKPSAARHIEQRAQTTEPNLMLFFGTGQYLAAGDNTQTDQQRFYGVWDSGAPSLNMSHLTAQVIDTTTPVVNTGSESVTVRTISSNTVDYSAVKGWRIDLPVSKERMVVTPIALGDLVFFNTMIPSTDMCSQGGTGWLMSVDQLTGGAPDFPVVDLNRNGVFDDLAESSVPVGIATGGIPTESRFLPTGRDAVRVTTDSSGKITARLVQPQETPSPGRMSWSGLNY